MVALYTSRDRAITEPLRNAEKSVARYLEFDGALEDHVRAWEDLWQVCDIRIPGRRAGAVPASPAHLARPAGLLAAHAPPGRRRPRRGLNGEAYRGHVFWDELYVYPFLNFRLPEITRGLLMYRYRRLGEARAAALEAGYAGAMYPWQSGSDGQEETQVAHLNPVSGLWEPDLSRNQRHVNAAIFYNIWHYYQATEDVGFLRDHGAEMMLEIARFWSSIAHFNPDRDRWEIHGVMGPDEFHDSYPGAAEGGLRNNAYTNVMAAWICETAQKVLDLLPATRRNGLTAKLRLGEEDLARWEDISRRMFVPFHGDGIISQFEGYEELEELDWDDYRARYDNIQRLDRILRAEGDDPNRYKLAKQADTVMLFFLFPEDELRRIFSRLGYEYAPDTARRNDRLLPAPDLPRLHAELHHPRGRSGQHRSRELVGAVRSRSGERHLRHPGRHDQGGHPSGSDVGHARSRPACVRGHGNPRGPSPFQSEADRPARRAVVPDAVPRDPDHGDARGRQAYAAR